ncbi:MAG: hypothetical protein ACRDQZ_08835 [Mycobacteriales bacterium]
MRDALARSDVATQHQDIRVDAEYNGWWACLIPSEVVAAIGYPLPLFFQWDDIDWYRYFNLRNTLIVHALYGRPNRTDTARFLSTRKPARRG